MTGLPIALQLYTVRDEMQKDFLGTLRRVAAMGYTAVEFAGDFGKLSARELKHVLAELNLRPISAHVGVDLLENDPGAAIDYQLELGNTNVVIPWMTAPADRAGWVEEASRLNAFGELCKQNDLQLSYHNHAHELALVDGTPGLDLLYQYTDASLLKSELDIYWVKKGGFDPVSYIHKLAGRLPLLHAKDMANDANGTFAEVGSGILNWDEIITAGRAAGVQWYIVEQDSCQRPCLESAEISLRYLQGKFGG